MKKKLMSFADTVKVTGELKKKLDDLFDLNSEIKILNKKLSLEKSRMSEYVKGKILETNKGKIFFVNGGTHSILNKDKIRNFLKQKLKISDEAVNKIFKEGSIQKIVGDYLKMVSTKGKEKVTDKK